jgi:hypothetical protein
MTFGRCRVLVVLVIVAALTDCVGAEEPSHPAVALEGVSDLLYKENLITDPEVNQRMNEYILKVSRDGVAADSVMPEFHQWLVNWARKHPERVADARARPAPYVGPKRKT